eukprot:NODE_220_length_12432_cov_0.484878.p1 type:complete len:644 gc:universal NODE_220_length_12432_cov_0.484878:10264-12195(+)
MDLKSDTADIKEDTEQITNHVVEMKEYLQTMMSQIDILESNHQNTPPVVQPVGISDAQMAEIRAMFVEMANLQNPLTAENLEETREIVIQSSKSFDIDYIDGIELFNNEILGSGSYGTVYLGEWHGIKVAIKQITHFSFNNPSSFTVKSDAFEKNKSVLREVKAFEKLNKSPFICSFYGVTSIDGKLGLVTEYLDNNSLYHWLYTDGKSLTDPQINKIRLGIARGLTYMHSHGIAHNDIKSNNIMLDSQLMPRIIDFGMVKMNNSTMSFHGKSKSVGTDHWRAPEYWDVSTESFQLRDQFPFAGDVFSFAIVLGEMATCQIPWDQRSEWDIERAISKGMRPYTSDQIKFSPLFEIIDKAWQQHPKDRYSMEDLLKKLESLGSSANFVIKHNWEYFAELTNPARIDNIFGNELLKSFKESIQTVNHSLFQSYLLKLVKIVKLYDIKSYIESLKPLNDKMIKLKTRETDLFILNIMAFLKIGIEKDNKEIFNDFVNSDHELSSYFIGYCYSNGLGVAENDFKAFQYFNKASELGIPAAHYYLGISYLYGKGCAVDHEMGLKYYQMAGESHFGEGYSAIGYLYRNGNIVEQNEKKALHYDELAKPYSYDEETGDASLKLILSRISPEVKKEVLEKYMLMQQNNKSK